MSTSGASQPIPGVNQPTAAQLITLKRKKFTTLSGEIKSINEMGRAALTDVSKINTFKGMFRSLDKLYERFSEIWDELTSLYLLNPQTDQFPSETDNTTLTAIRRYYYESCSTYEQLASSAAAQSSVPPASLNTTINSSRARLPDLKLPKFDGKLADWPFFRDTYLSLIHNDNSLSPIEKFHFLIGSLEKSALAVIKPIPILEANYTQAWEALVACFDNKRKLAVTYLNQLINFKPLQGKSSLQSLRSFLSVVSESVTSFKNLNIPDTSEFILFVLAIRCLDVPTREAFELKYSDTAFPTFENLVTFVKNKCHALSMTFEEVSATHNKPPISFPSRNEHQRPKVGPQPKNSTILLSNSSQQVFVDETGSKSSTCFVCSRVHKLMECQTFLSASPRDRFNLLKKFKGCRNCLHPSHTAKQCTSKWTCRLCNKMHHTLLHLPDDPKPSAKPISTKEPSVKPAENTVPCDSPSAVLTSTPRDATRVLLGTALARIQDSQGDFHSIRLVVDSGSQQSFISEKYAELLGMPRSISDTTISGIGKAVLPSTKYDAITCVLRPLKHDEPIVKTKCIILPIITHQLPQQFIPDAIWKKYVTLELADPSFWRPGAIDFLLGADLFGQIISDIPRSLDNSGPQVMKTIFGDVLLGPFDERPSNTLISAFCCPASQIDVTLRKFWELEDVKPATLLSNEDLQCEEHFRKTHYRQPTGRYVVSLPFRNEPVCLGESKPRALSRLYHLEKKLAQNPELRRAYDEFLGEYAELGHMSKATCPAEYVIPHHAVIKTDSDQHISKLRVVFDGASKTNLGSLNDQLLTGPKLQQDIRDILLNFRRHPVVFTCDIVKMYRQILINPTDRRFQHILWRNDPSQEVVDYELNTVTYGLSCSPYLALRVIRQLVLDEGAIYPIASQVLLHDIYIDDIVTGAQSVPDAQLLKTEIIQLLAKGGFTLSKWSSNCLDLLSDGQSESRQLPLQLGSDESTVAHIKILGLQWDPGNDTFSYEVDSRITSCTKRSILSTIAKIYDPLGYLTPVVFLAKCILQRIWRAGLDWDEHVPSDIEESWQRFVDELHYIKEIRIPRFLASDTNAFHLMGFCDASQKGYCAALYLLTQNHQNMYLLIAKSKLAPLKPVTIPRLELCAALLLSRLYLSSTDFLKHLNILDHFFFTDSSVVMGWMRMDPFRLKTFVSNRIGEILETTRTAWWRHITSENNPADCGSRGLLPSKLLHNALWWAGPAWATSPRESWPESSINQHYSDLPELKADNVVLITMEPSDFLDIMERFSSYSKLLRTIAWIQRFLSNSRLKQDAERIRGPLSASEIRDSELLLISILQHHFYSEAFMNPPKFNLFLSSLNCFVDSQGILRVGGRLTNSPLPTQQKHPILLPRRCHFNSILVDYYHKLYLHIGPASLQAMIQRTYWIPSARRLIRQRKLKCLVCYRSSRIPVAPFMGNLPASRFSQVRAFEHTGVDLAGPFLCKETARRNAAVLKSYLVVFICFSTKAIHLEMASSLSTESFLDALDRFIARRGIPARIESDNGTNFVGAKNYLSEIYQWFSSKATHTAIADYVSGRGISWHFNPPHAPHFGGLWEAGVKSAKALLHKIVGQQPCTEWELATIFTKIEAILNSRPLTPLSTDSSDLEPLTPGHFLIGQPLVCIPEPDWVPVPENRLSRWQRVRQRVQHFWQRWRDEYLQTLQRRSKWTSHCNNLKVGDMILTCEPNMPLLKWPLGRVTEVHPGRDGIVRVATIRTSQGTCKRPVHKLVSLDPLTSSH